MNNINNFINKELFYRYGIDYKNRYFLETDLPYDIEDWESAYNTAYNIFKEDYQNWNDSVRYYICSFLKDNNRYIVQKVDFTESFINKLYIEVNPDD